MRRLRGARRDSRRVTRRHARIWCLCEGVQRLPPPLQHRLLERSVASRDPRDAKRVGGLAAGCGGGGSMRGRHRAGGSSVHEHEPDAVLFSDLLKEVAEAHEEGPARTQHSVEGLSLLSFIGRCFISRADGVALSWRVREATVGGLETAKAAQERDVGLSCG